MDARRASRRTPAGNGHYQSPSLCNYQSPYCTPLPRCAAWVSRTRTHYRLVLSRSPSQITDVARVTPLLIHKTVGIRPWTRHHHKACQAVRAFPAHKTRGSARATNNNNAAAANMDMNAPLQIPSPECSADGGALPLSLCSVSLHFPCSSFATARASLCLASLALSLSNACLSLSLSLTTATTATGPGAGSGR